MGYIESEDRALARLNAEKRFKRAGELIEEHRNRMSTLASQRGQAAQELIDAHGITQAARITGVSTRMLKKSVGRIKD